MANNTSSSVTHFPNYMIYQLFSGAGPCSALIVPAVLMNVAGVPGIASNILLILVTWRNKSLRGSANFLLALTAFFEILHQSAHFLFLFVSLSGINFIPYSVALRFQLHSIFGVTAAQTVMAATAADRLLCVLTSLNYDRINGFWYLFGHTLLAIGCGAWMASKAVLLSLQDGIGNLPVTGYLSDLLILDMAPIFVFIMVLCALNILLYVLVWLVVIVFRPAGFAIHGETQARLLKSLVLIVAIVIGGYFVNNICHLVVNTYFSLDDLQVWSVNVFGGILLNLGASAETPTLYVFSSEYRKAINLEFKCLFGLKKSKINTVMPINPVNNSRSRVVLQPKNAINSSSNTGRWAN